LLVLFSPSSSESMICRLLAPSSLSTSQKPLAAIRQLRIVTLLALPVITSGVVMSLFSITVPAVVIRDGPVYAVNDVPTGTPVDEALGNAWGGVPGVRAR